MSMFMITLFSALAVINLCEGQEKPCTDGVVLTEPWECPDTCDNVYLKKDCEDAKMFKTNCKCNDGFILNKDGVCQALESCLRGKCKENAIFRKNPCIKTCREFVFTPDIDCRVQALPGCVCTTGYYLGESGDCVKADQCYQESGLCPGNSVYSKRPCSKTCKTMITSTTCGMNLKPGCQCTDGFFLTKNSVCVAPKDCDEVNCKTNSAFSPKPCIKTCQQLLLNEPCTDSAPNCLCKSGFYVNQAGECVNADACQKENPCKANGVFKSTPCVRTCESMFTKDACVTKTAAGCQCDDGYFESSKGICVKRSQCTGVTCPADSEFSVTRCVYTCKNYLFNDACPHSPNNGVCSCKEGYYFNHEDKCIPREQCINDKDICPINSHFEYDPCIRTCKEDVTTNKACMRNGLPGCQCDAGYFKNSRDECVLPNNCDNVECGDNSKFKSSHCVSTCKSKLFGEACEEILGPSCYCEDGYFSDYNANCITVADCKVSPGVCSENSVYKDEPCSKTCLNLFSAEPCAPDIPGCECEDGFLKTKDGTCVQSQDCDDVECEVNAVFTTIACENTCRSLLFREQCTLFSEPHCTCASGFNRNSQNECVDHDACENDLGLCPADKMFSRTPCSKTCKTMFSQEECNAEETPGCQCKAGLYINKNGDCVADRKCDEVTCSANTVFKVDGCQHTCKTFLFNEPCVHVEGAKCVCDDEHYLNSNNECVDADMCKQETDLCSTDKIFSDTPCSRTCQTMFSEGECVAEKTRGCQCKADLYKNENGDCVTDRKCDAVTCSANTVFKVDGCQHTCKTFLFNEPCVHVEGAKCVCDDKHYLNSNNECVDADMCKQETDLCSTDKIFSDTPCSRTCQTMFSEGECVAETTRGCQCKADLYKNENGDCVTDTKCDAVTCSAKTVFKVDGCQHTCKTFLFNEPCVHVEGAKCVCDDEHYLNSNNECVDADMCKQETDLCSTDKIFSDTPCSRTCQTMFSEGECVAETTRGCQCKADLYKNENGDCVTDTKCDAVTCSAKTVFKVDGCQHTCKTFLFNEPCVHVAGAKCVCDDEHYLNSNNECVDEDMCKQETDLCSSDKIFSDTPCSKTCQTMFSEGECEAEKTRGCECKDDLYRNKNGDCVTDRECDEVKCSANTVFEVDGCQHTCKSFLFYESCTDIAGAKCVCDAKHYLNSNNECVDEDTCKQEIDLCSSDKIFSDNPCSRTCETMFSVGECEAEWTRGCQCKDDLYRNKNGDCVTDRKCDEVICSTNTIFKVDGCQHTCKTFLFDEPCIDIAGANCLCDDEHYLNSNNECVDANTCKQEIDLCSDDKFFSDTPCSKTCKTMFSEEGCILEDTPGCQCRSDLYKNKNGDCVAGRECDEVTCSADTVFKVDGCQHTCKTFLFDEPCPHVAGAACVCDDVHYLNSNDECVDVNTCKQETDLCSSDKVFSDKPCSRTCETMFSEGECVADATPGCQCQADLLRNKNGDCVTDRECVEVKCSTNTVFKVDGCQETCKTFLFDEPCIDVAGAKCICDDDHYLNSNNECVDENTCKLETDLCSSDKIFSDTPCSRTCKTMFSEGECVAEDTRGCQCKAHMFRNKNGDCVNDRECDEVICSVNTVFKVDGCQHTCKSFLFNKPCIDVAGAKCVCDDMHYLNSNNECVDGNTCKQETDLCSSDKIFSDKPCSRTCKTMFSEAECIAEETPGCQCQADLLRNKYGDCVRDTECDEVTCSANTVFKVNGCQHTCRTHLFNQQCIAVVGASCVCSDNYYRNSLNECVEGTMCELDKDICPVNAIYKRQPCKRTCDQWLTKTACTPDLTPGCQCNVNYLLNKNDECVLPEKCDVNCGDNAIFGAPSCEHTCISLLMEYNCQNNAELVCHCKAGYYRRSDGNCVTALDCHPDEKLVCTGNAEYSTTPNIKTCANRVAGQNIDTFTGPGCQCKTGYYKNNNNVCVLEDQCENYCSEANTLYSALSCDRTCKNKLLGETCVEKSGCHCIPGFYRSGAGVCIPEADCPKEKGICQLYSMYSEKACIKTCELMFEEPSCVNPGCECIEGFYLNVDGLCVPAISCDNVKCPPDTVYKKTPCVSSCRNYLLGEPCRKRSAPTCQCANGLYRHTNGKCVSGTECEESSTPQVTCSETNTVFDKYSCDLTCENKLLNQPCSTTPKPACRCRNGFYRDSDGRCVSEAICIKDQACPMYSHYMEKACIRTCENMFDEPKCEKAGCECFDGFFQNEYGDCVATGSCKNVKCKDNAVFTKTPCVLTCKDFMFGERCTKTVTPLCQCQAGFYQNSNGDCVNATKCADDLDICEDHEIFQTIPCSISCLNMFNGAKCTRNPRPGCQCKDTFYLDAGQYCVAPQECDEVKCPKNAEFKKCSRDCPISCGNMFLEPECVPKCIPKCVCTGNTVFNSKGLCVERSTCSVAEIKCPSNLMYLKCGNQEHKTCENYDDDKVCMDPCVAGCYCDKGLAYDSDTKTCVPPSQCTHSWPNQACRSIDHLMVYLNCHDGPPKTCRNRHAGLTEPKCRPGCYCKEGYALSLYNNCILEESCPVLT